MIKQLVRLVMPKQLSFFGTALAVGSAALSLKGNSDKRKKQNEAISERKRVDQAVRKEQNTRSRINLMRNARIAGSQVEAQNLAGGGTGDSSGSINALNQIRATTDTGFGNLNTANSTAELIANAKQKSIEAGQDSDITAINKAVQPLIMNNVGSLNDFGSILGGKVGEGVSSFADGAVDIFQPFANSGTDFLNSDFLSNTSKSSNNLFIK